MSDRYQAFISYSHADQAVARSLHRALETFRVPKNLVGMETAAGVVPHRLRRIFKDREELPAAGSLNAEIDRALAASDALIVICSRAAAQSRWVNEEVRVFKKLHGESRVFAVIVDGTPSASGLPGREAEECLPPALRFAVDADGTITDIAAEPLAADYRRQGDGRRLATLKLVAGLTGIRLDDLVQRDAQRRTRIARQVAVAASVLAVAMAGLTFFAVSARNDARRQHEMAEGLIEFMLTDLRKKLEPVGRLDVLDAVGERALAHYNVEDDSSLDANALGHRSRALHLIGEIRQNRGKLDEALVAFQRAAATTEQLLQRAPNDAQRIFDHGQSVFWVGFIARERGQHKAAERAFQLYRDYSIRLVRLNDVKSEWQVEPAYAATNVGIVMLDDGRPIEALKFFDEARLIYEGLLPRHPELASDFAHAYGWMSLARERLGDFDGAIAMQREKQRYFLTVPDAERNQQVQRGLQNVAAEIGRMELARGRLLESESSALSSVERATRMAALDTENLYWLGQLCDAQLWLAEVQLALQRATEARATLARAEVPLRRMLARDKTKIDWQVGAHGKYLDLWSRFSSASKDAIIERLAAYAAIAQEFIKADKMLRTSQLLPYAEVELRLAKLQAAKGDRVAELGHLRVVNDLLAPFEKDNNYHLLTLLARARLSLGERDAARILKTRIEGSAYRHPNFAEFINEWEREKGFAPKSKGVSQ